MGYRVAVVGATGNVGREIFNILEELEFPISEIYAVASRRSLGVEVSFGERTLKCEDLEQFDFRKVDIVLMSASTSEVLCLNERLFDHSPVTPAARANDATDVHIPRGGKAYLAPHLGDAGRLRHRVRPYRPGSRRPAGRLHPAPRLLDSARMIRP